jgi:hypothetical protein
MCRNNKGHTEVCNGHTGVRRIEHHMDLVIEVGNIGRYLTNKLIEFRVTRRKTFFPKKN